jgi:glycosyltransferase involved in cell wall biosynthesis
VSAGSHLRYPPAPAILLWPGCDAGPWREALDDLLIGTEPANILIPGSESGRALLDALEPGDRARVRLLARAPHFAAALAEALESCPGGDLVVLARPGRLPAEWLIGLAHAATSDDTVIGASPLIAGGPGKLFAGYEEIPPGPQVARPVGSLPVGRPRIARLSTYCAYLRRSALELLEGPDQALRDPAPVLDDLATRALALGLSCALADDVVLAPVDDLSPAPAPAPAPAPVPAAALLAQEELAGADVGPLRHALLMARARSCALSVTIDARGIGGGFGGTQTYTTALIRALSASERVRVRAVVGEEFAADLLRAGLAQDRVEILTYSEVLAGVPRSDVVHRPQQAFSPDDRALLRLLGERVVLTHLDLIAYRSPSYHSGLEQWRGYRRTTRLALGTADRVVFLSDHARRDAIAEELVSAERSAVVGIGIERGRGGPARRPARLAGEAPLLVMLGADYGHKNRPFAFRLLGQLRQRGWSGRLVMAGAHVEHGSSAAQEAEQLSSDPDLAEHIIDLGPVDEPEKNWLLSSAAALLCPSTYEGFGLTPLEAISAGLPCVYPNLTSLGEVLGPESATIVPWDAAASAARVLPLLRPGSEREAHLARLAGVLERFRWESVVERLLAVYEAAVSSPYRAATVRGWEELKREEYIIELDHRLRDLRSRVSFGMILVDRDGLLTRAQQRGLMRLASRRWVRGPLLGPLGLLGQLGTGEPD